MLLGKLGAKTANILDVDNLELVVDLRDEGGDLLLATVHRGLGACLLKVQVAGCHGGRVSHGSLKKVKLR